MRFVSVLVGLMVLVGSLSFFYVRYVAETPRLRVNPSAYRTAPAPSAAPQAPATRSARPPAAERQQTQASNPWAWADTALNLANVVVGVLGIWMTLRGMRMQQAAALRGDRR